MRSEFLSDQVDLPVVHFPRDLLAEQQAVEHVVESSQLRHGLLLCDAGVVCRCGGVFILFKRVIERAESGAAHFCVGFQLIIVLEQGITQRIFLAVHGKGIKADIRELHGVIDVVGREFLGHFGDGHGSADARDHETGMFAPETIDKTLEKVVSARNSRATRRCCGWTAWSASMSRKSDP